MTQDQKLKMVYAMRRYGGSFVKALAECFLVADSNNLRILEKAFPLYVNQYTEMAGDEIRFGSPEDNQNDYPTQQEESEFIASTLPDNFGKEKDCND